MISAPLRYYSSYAVGSTSSVLARAVPPTIFSVISFNRFYVGGPGIPWFNPARLSHHTMKFCALGLAVADGV
jgi:hypothetical protein